MKIAAVIVLAIALSVNSILSVNAAVAQSASVAYGERFGLDQLIPLIALPPSIAVLESEYALIEAQQKENQTQFDDLDRQTKRYLDLLDDLDGQTESLDSQLADARSQRYFFLSQVELLKQQLSNLPEETSENADELAEIRAEINSQILAFENGITSLDEQIRYYSRQSDLIVEQRLDYERLLDSLNRQSVAFENQIRGTDDQKSIIRDKIENAKETSTYALQVFYYNACLEHENIMLLKRRLELFELQIEIESTKMSLGIPDTTQFNIDSLIRTRNAAERQLEVSKLQADLLEEGIIDLLTVAEVNIDYIIPDSVSENHEYSLKDLTLSLIRNSTVLSEYNAQIKAQRSLTDSLIRVTGANDTLYRLRLAELNYMIAQRNEYSDSLGKYAASKYNALLAIESIYAAATSAHQTAGARMAFYLILYEAGEISGLELLSEQLSLQQSQLEAKSAIVNRINSHAEIELLARGIVVE